MDRYSWMIRFERKDGKQDEELYFNEGESAREAFRLFDEPDNADLYSRVELVKVDWHERSEEVLDGLSF